MVTIIQRKDGRNKRDWFSFLFRAKMMMMMMMRSPKKRSKTLLHIKKGIR